MDPEAHKTEAPSKSPPDALVDGSLEVLRVTFDLEKLDIVAVQSNQANNRPLHISKGKG